jgi:hypothetical protein
MYSAIRRYTAVMNNDEPENELAIQLVKSYEQGLHSTKYGSTSTQNILWAKKLH